MVHRWKTSRCADSDCGPAGDAAGDRCLWELVVVVCSRTDFAGSLARTRILLSTRTRIACDPIRKGGSTPPSPATGAYLDLHVQARQT